MNRTGLPAGQKPRLLPNDLQIDHRVIERSSSEWPSVLDQLEHDCPRRLHASGRPLEPDRMMLAIVGSRRPTAIGIEMAEKFARELAQAGFVIVSGLAMGIDAIAHKAAVAGGGTTLAVLGCGLDVSYPHRNLYLRRLIDQNGTVVSEYRRGTPPLPHHFPARNRIVAGLCEGVLIVEGSDRSGALITARLGLDYNRQVFAIPGSPWNAMAAAPNTLIRTSRALLVTEPEHVFEELAPKLAWAKADESHAVTVPSLEEDDVLVLHVLTDRPLIPERIARCTGIPTARTSLALSRLAVRGFAHRSPLGYRITGSGASAVAAIDRSAAVEAAN